MQKILHRSDRVSALIQKNLSALIQKSIKDPRFPNFVTISFVKLTPDLTYARVYITVLDQTQGDIAVKILNKVSGYLRGVLGKTLKLRVAPALKFVYDDSIEYGQNLSELIDSLNPDSENEN